MYCDAILQSGQGIRAEATLRHTLYFNDMIEYRINVLKKKTELPIYVIITSSGNVPFETIFSPKYKTLIVSTEKGAKQFKEYVKSTPDYKSSQTVDEFIKGQNAEVVTIDALPNNKDKVDLKKLLLYLRKQHNVEFVDVTAGGKTIAEMVYYGLLDEVRMTIAGQVIGQFSNNGIERPTFFEMPKECGTFTVNNCPLLDYIGLRYYGTKHIYLRSKIIYRHLK